jgi:hypothetical protein
LTGRNSNDEHKKPLSHGIFTNARQKISSRAQRRRKENEMLTTNDGEDDEEDE